MWQFILLICIGLTNICTSIDQADNSLRLQPIPERVTKLLAKMTVNEKIGQLVSRYGSDADADIKKWGKLGIGSSSQPNLATRNKLQNAIINGSRLGIPVAFIHESLHGGASGGTVFPMPLTLGASWNTSLVTAVYDVVANETRASGAEIAFAPVINLFMDPRFGRHQEGFSPNPMLTAEYARASVIGLQGSGTGNATSYLDQKHVIALGKHFAGYGGAIGGLNAAPLQAGERMVRDVFLLPWLAFAKAGGRGAMPSHQTVLDVPCHANDWLVNKVFRQELGFGQGLTISDCNDINVLMDYRIARNVSEAAAEGLIGGVDQDLQCGGTTTYTLKSINDALNDGLVTEAILDTAVSHVLTMKFAAGLFEHPLADPALQRYLNNPDHQALALDAAKQGIVLLKNKNKCLPLSPSDKIVVLGPLGDNWDHQTARQAMLGPYTSDNGKVSVPSIKEAIARITTGNVSYAQGCYTDKPSNDSMINQAVFLAKKASVVILALGDSISTCGEWKDRSSLDLPGGQLQLLEAVVAAVPQNTKVIVALVGGRPATFGAETGNKVLTKLDAVLWVGRGGQEGATGLASIMFGHTNPSGKLPSSWPRSVGQVGSGSTPWLQAVRGKWVSNHRGPQDPDGRRYDQYALADNDPSPLFYFGYGLSFTTFVYSDLSLDNTHVKDYPLRIQFTVKNTGGVQGDEVSQVYIQDPIGGTHVVRPWKRLVGFSRVNVHPNDSKRMTLDIAFEYLALHGESMQFEIQPGLYTVSVGGASNTDSLHGTITL